MAYLFRLILNLFRSLLFPFWLYRRWAWSRGDARWIRVEIKPRILPFRGGQSALERLTAPARDGSTSLEGLRALADQVERDPRVRGVLFTLPPLEAGWTACQAVREIFLQLRAAGKQVVCYLSQGGGNRELYVALAADRVVMAPYASLGPLGFAMQPVYFRPLLDRLGVRVQALATGEYKSAAEPGMRDSMSDATREQLHALLAAKHAALIEALQARALSESELDALFTRSLLLADEAEACRIIDGVAYEDELPELLRAHSAGASAAPKPLPAARYLRLKRPLWLALRRSANIAVVPLHGMISGESSSGFGAGLRLSTFAPLMRELAKDPEVAAIVLHIDSPGGSALTSELMHREIKQLASKKPVVACFGEVAASGGYYIACACNKIVARELCTTGSIGVVMAKIDAQELVTQIGLRPQLLRTAASADMLSSIRGLSEHEEGLLRAHIAKLYQRFLSVAADGRGRTMEHIDSVARGRVWTGSAARDHGLVDAIGGMDHALSQARALLPALSEAQRSSLRPRVYRLKSNRGLGGLRALALGPWLRALEALATRYELQREAALYYAPSATFE